MFGFLVIHFLIHHNSNRSDAIVQRDKPPPARFIYMSGPLALVDFRKKEKKKSPDRGLVRTPTLIWYSAVRKRLTSQCLKPGSTLPCRSDAIGAHTLPVSPHSDILQGSVKMAIF